MKCQQFSDVFEIFHFVRALLLLEKMYINLLGLNCSSVYHYIYNLWILPGTQKMSLQ